MHQPPQSTRSAGPSSITLPPPPVFSSFTLQGFTPDRSPPSVGQSPNLGFNTAPSSPFSESPSPGSPPTQWYTPPTTPQTDLSDTPTSPRPPESVPSSAPLLVPQRASRPAAEQETPIERNESSDDAFPSIIDLAFDSGFDEEGLSTLEKIYLYSSSDSSVHRTFIAHALPSYLEHVTPQEAVEYVLPLIHNLAVDEDESVKAALAAELVPVIWWFFSHCQLIPDDLDSLQPYASTSTMVTISVQSFTPILGTLLLGTSEKIFSPTRFAVLDLLARMRRADSRDAGLVPSPDISSKRLPVNLAFLSNNLVEDEDEELVLTVGLFKNEERTMFRQELLHSVIIGMSRLDMDMDYEDQERESPTRVSEASQASESSSRQSSPDNPYFPPLPPKYEEAYDVLGSDARKAALGRVSSMSLMAAVTATGSLDKESQWAFVKEIERVGRDTAYFYVRREASLALGALAKVVPDELVAFSLRPLFDALRWDPDFRVRQSALFALPAILPRLTPSHRRTVALETAMALSKDRYGIVRVGVLETLGEVLHTFLNDPGGPPNELLELFLGRREDGKVREGRDWMCYNEMEPQPADQALEFFYRDSERPLICAFNFPAVVLTLGASRWPELREYYLDLSRNTNVHVRKTMAASLGEIARIIGQDAAQKELVPLWWESLHFDDESVREKAVEILDVFLPLLGRPIGKQLLEGVLRSWEEGKFRGWREREAIILSLEKYLELLGCDGAGTIVRRLLVKGLQDGVAAVRECVYSVLPRIWDALSSDPVLLAQLEADLEAFSRSSSFRQRMTFIACMQTRAQHTNQAGLRPAVDAIFKSVSHLATDPVIDLDQLGLFG
ncbi:hypothetical protein EST38_g6981 [Candolleomyces aberdarensis]|uniref:ARM repeat-containing protein n=1 Tax=Candolleomyces aberdarensis TaxID=2316362 RepID=A0A4Q2DJP4_9AGAR|nr:hypothetical protein EST38_g6981 [Candolleomyces aberdarensis]